MHIRIAVIAGMGLLSGCTTIGQGFVYEKENYNLTRHTKICIDVENPRIRDAIKQEIEKEGLSIVETDCSITLWVKTEYENFSVSTRTVSTTTSSTVTDSSFLQSILQSSAARSVVSDGSIRIERQIAYLFAFEKEKFENEIRNKKIQIEQLKEWSLWWAHAWPIEDRSNPNSRTLCDAMSGLAKTFAECNNRSCSPWGASSNSSSGSDSDSVQRKKRRR